MSIFSYQNFPVAVLIALPWIALVAIRFVYARTENATIVAGKSRAFTCSLFLGISALAWGVLDIQPGPYTLWFGFPPLSIPLLAMIVACIGIITNTLLRHSSDTWLWLLAITSIAYPILYIWFILIGSRFTSRLLFTYAGFAIITALMWYFSKQPYEDKATTNRR